jgi:hypothetical protein
MQSLLNIKILKGMEYSSAIIRNGGLILSTAKTWNEIPIYSTTWMNLK